MEVPDNAGMVREVVADVPRFPFVNVGGERLPALHLEPADTSNLLRSEAIDNAAWTKTELTVTANAAMAPDGQQTADRGLETVVSSTHRIFQGSIAITDGADVCVLGFFRRVPGSTDRNAYLRMDAGAGTVQAFFTLSGDGTISGTAGTGGATFVDAYVERLDNGWYLCAIVGSQPAGETSITAEYRIWIPTLNTVYAGDVTKGLYFGGLQAADDVIGVASYMGVTAGSSISRAVEAMRWIGAPSPQAMIVYLDMVLTDTLSDNAPNGRLLNIGAGDNSDPSLFLDNDASKRIRVQFDNDVDALVSTTVTLTTPVAGDRVQIIASLESDGSGRLVISHNGGTASGSDFSAPASGIPSSWSADTIRLNTRNGSNNVHAGKYRRLVIVSATNIDAAVDGSGTSDDELVAEMAEIEVTMDRRLRELF